MANWKVTSAPASEPVTRAEAKVHLNIPSAVTDWNALIDRQIATARRYVEQYANVCLITQTIRQYFDEFPCDWIELTCFPIQSVTHVKYTDTAGSQQTWDSSKYRTDLVSRHARIAPKSGQDFPENSDEINSIEAEYVAGYGNAAAVPEHYKDAILLLVGHLFENREDTVHTMPTKVLDILHRSANWNF